MIIDNKGRIFGKVNIIDLVIFLLIIGLLAGAGYKYKKAGVASPFNSPQNVEIAFYTEEVSDFVAKSIKTGDFAKDFERGATLGNIKEFKINISNTQSFISGVFIPSAKPGYCSVNIIVKGKGIKNPKGGVTLDGIEYLIGREVFLQAGNTYLKTKVSEIR